MNETKSTSHALPVAPDNPADLSRRGFFEKLCLALGGVCGAILGLPLVGFIVAPLFRKAREDWITVGGHHRQERRVAASRD